jgi:ribosomal protein S18 acetylase RimI-like enzyme
MTPEMNSVFVRDADPHDQDVIDKHRRDSAEESSRYRGSVETPESVTELRTFVAGFNDTVFASLTVGKKGDAAWHICHVFVEPQAREVGIGDALVRHVLDVLTDVGAQWISAHALPGDRAMKNLFERHGLVAQTITVGRAINDPSTGVDASQ